MSDDITSEDGSQTDESTCQRLRSWGKNLSDYAEDEDESMRPKWGTLRIGELWSGKIEIAGDGTPGTGGRYKRRCMTIHDIHASAVEEDLAPRGSSQQQAKLNISCYYYCVAVGRNRWSIQLHPCLIREQLVLTTNNAATSWCTRVGTSGRRWWCFLSRHGQKLHWRRWSTHFAKTCRYNFLERSFMQPTPHVQCLQLELKMKMSGNWSSKQLWSALGDVDNGETIKIAARDNEIP